MCTDSLNIFIIIINITIIITNINNMNIMKTKPMALDMRTILCIQLREQRKLEQQKVLNQYRPICNSANHQTAKTKRCGVGSLIAVWVMLNETVQSHVIFVDRCNCLKISFQCYLNFALRWLFNSLYQCVNLHIDQNIKFCDCIE